ncbi:fluoride efflux transporter FluC [Agromyces soli]
MTVVEHARDTAHPIPRPAFRRPKLILYVLLGGAIGTAARLALTLVMRETEIPWDVVVVNVVGAFILGFVLTALAARGPETPHIRDLRLFVGTGMMGGFTTYSSLATGAATLLESSAVVATVFALGTVLAGLASGALGVWAGGRVRPRAAQAAGEGGTASPGGADRMPR